MLFSTTSKTIRAKRQALNRGGICGTCVHVVSQLGHHYSEPRNTFEKELAISPTISMPSFEEYRKYEKKALAGATAVARALCDAKPVSSRLCPFQGMFSCTVIVTLSDKSEVGH